MGDMPEWFAKTPEMCASDLWFSGVCTDEEKIQLGQKYLAALQKLQTDPRGFFGQSDALDNSPDFDQQRISTSLTSPTSHFRRDWISQHYNPTANTTFHFGGRFWPTIPSEEVLDVLEKGTRMGIMKALGETNLTNMGVNANAIEDLFEHERTSNVNTVGVLPLATSWNCVAAPGSNFFEATALRGPTVVELAIATPRPVALTRFAVMIEKIRHSELSLDAQEFNVDIVP